MTLNMILEEVSKNFIEKKLKELKKKFPNIPYKIYSEYTIISEYRRMHSYEDQQLHSYEDQPAYLYYNKKIKEKYWYEYGNPHRDGDKPAIIKYYENGKIERKIYYKNGVFHRDNNKPAFIMYNKNGKIIRVEYWKNGKQYHPLPGIDDESQNQTRRDLSYNSKS